MILFHSCLVHASSSNLSPWNRRERYLSLCAVSTISAASSPEYIAHRDFSPIQCLPDDCLLRDYDVPRRGDGTPEEAIEPPSLCIDLSFRAIGNDSSMKVQRNEMNCTPNCRSAKRKARARRADGAGKFGPCTLPGAKTPACIWPALPTCPRKMPGQSPSA